MHGGVVLVLVLAASCLAFVIGSISSNPSSLLSPAGAGDGQYSADGTGYTKKDVSQLSVNSVLNPTVDFLADNMEAIVGLVGVRGKSARLHVGVALETAYEARWAARDIARLFPQHAISIVCFAEQGCQRGTSYVLWENNAHQSATVYCGPLYYALQLMTLNSSRVKLHLTLLDKAFKTGDERGLLFLRSNSQHFLTGKESLILGSHVSWEAPLRALTAELKATPRDEAKGPIFADLSRIASKWGISLHSARVAFPCPSENLARILEFDEWRSVDLSPFTPLNKILDERAFANVENIVALRRHRSFLKKGNVEGASWQLHIERQVYVALAQLPEVKTICEIGFNAGHSAALWLRGNPNATVYMFDLFHHKYGRINEAFLREEGQRYGLHNVSQRLITIEGSSLETVPKFRKEWPDIVCDLLSVDGGHSDDIPLRDMINMRALANPKFHVLVVDDSNCEERFCVAVDDGILKLEKEGAISVLGRWSESPDGDAFQRGLTVMQYNALTNSP
jgi:hypothetical protein